MARDEYDAWAERWVQGMRAARPFVDERRRAQAQIAKRNRADGAKRRCGIAGCKRHAYKGRLCRKHYDLVPYSEKVGTMISVYQAQQREAHRRHGRYLRIARELVAADPSLL